MWICANNELDAAKFVTEIGHLTLLSHKCTGGKLLHVHYFLVMAEHSGRSKHNFGCLKFLMFRYKFC